MCTTCEVFMEFTFQEGGENLVEAFKSSGKLSSNRIHEYEETVRQEIQETG
jgi:hypothetical protein